MCDRDQTLLIGGSEGTRISTVTENTDVALGVFANMLE